MKKIPESFQLDEDDIKEAIEYWLNNSVNDGEYHDDFDVEFKTETRRVPPPGGHRGGMSDDVVVNIVTATATKRE